jgi:hypothetical protein
VSREDPSGRPLDVATLEVLAGRARAHPLVDGRAFQPDAMSPRRLAIHLDAGQYPASVDAARLDVRWFDGGDYTVHYLESRGDDTWQCRWDRHPKPTEPRAHFYPPPDASEVEPSELGTTHHMDVLFAVLDWIAERIEQLHGR